MSICANFVKYEFIGKIITVDITDGSIPRKARIFSPLINEKMKYTVVTSYG